MTTNPTQNSSEELTELAIKITEIAFNGFHNQPTRESAAQDLSDMTALLASHLQAYTEEIRREVIGDDWNMDGNLRQWEQKVQEYVNRTKRTQRKRLDRIAKEWGVK